MYLVFREESIGKELRGLREFLIIFCNMMCNVNFFFIFSKIFIILKKMLFLEFVEIMCFYMGDVFCLRLLMWGNLKK